MALRKQSEERYWKFNNPAHKPHPFKGAPFTAEDFTRPRPQIIAPEDRCLIAVKCEDDPAYKQYVQFWMPDPNRANTTGMMASACNQRARALILPRAQTEWAVANLFHYNLYFEYYYRNMRYFVLEPEQLARKERVRSLTSKECRHCWHFVQNAGGALVRHCCFCGEIMRTPLNRGRHGEHLLTLPE